MDRLVEGWTEQARALAAEQSAGRPRRVIAVRVPEFLDDPHSHRQYDSLSEWEGAVIATYQVATYWHLGMIALWVPHGIAERLLVTLGRDARDLALSPEEWAEPLLSLLGRET